MSRPRHSWLVLAILCAVLLGGCTAIAGDLSHWPGSLSAVALILMAKPLNERWQFLKWPMEFAFWAAVAMILCSLVWLHFKPT